MREEVGKVECSRIWDGNVTQYKNRISHKIAGPNSQQKDDYIMIRIGNNVMRGEFNE